MKMIRTPIHPTERLILRVSSVVISLPDGNKYLSDVIRNERSLEERIRSIPVEQRKRLLEALKRIGTKKPNTQKKK